MKNSVLQLYFSLQSLYYISIYFFTDLKWKTFYFHLRIVILIRVKNISAHLLHPVLFQTLHPTCSSKAVTFLKPLVDFILYKFF